MYISPPSRHNLEYLFLDVPNAHNIAVGALGIHLDSNHKFYFMEKYFLPFEIEGFEPKGGDEFQNLKISENLWKSGIFSEFRLGSA